MSDNYTGGVPSLSVEDAIEITELCLLAGAANQITHFFACRFTPGEVRDRLSAATKTTAAATPVSPGGPTPQQADALAAALKKRFEAMYPKSVG